MTSPLQAVGFTISFNQANWEKIVLSVPGFPSSITSMQVIEIAFSAMVHGEEKLASTKSK